ncbi:hypothetical protein SAMN05421812_1218 [Asanoa hainanensis]|uniref:Peptidase inhibitor family I36 n=1 Tax=Asanoa hainanensis TaxID=560556 RepID=A0A239PDY3_9ACTN|nr:hypothetical protein [Asanoa hainanensis]SNT65240.1 hypothetical protein SAMN05421812_1218 [Asanoa hainanensis]
MKLGNTTGLVRRAISAAAAILLTVLVGLAVSSTAAQAIPPVEPGSGPPCSWAVPKDKSLCDGWVPYFEGQYNNYCRQSPTQQVGHVKIWAGSLLLADVFLNYNRGERTSAYPNGTCRTIYASIVAFHDVSCYAKVQRNSDGQSYATYEWDSNYSPVVYDADTTSYAWGICTYEGRSYSAQTGNY